MQMQAPPPLTVSQVPWPLHVDDACVQNNTIAHQTVTRANSNSGHDFEAIAHQTVGTGGVHVSIRAALVAGGACELRSASAGNANNGKS